MVHLPSSETHQEILNVPHLVRMTEAYGDGGSELTLIIRCSSLDLKFLVQQDYFDISMMKLHNNVLCYAIKIIDSQESPLMFWSAVKSADELLLFNRLLTDRRVVVHLYNEACINSAWNEVVVELGSEFLDIMRKSTYLKADVGAVADEVNHLLDKMRFGDNIVARFHISRPWQAIKATYITNGLRPCNINFLKDEEGGQQEELARWLTDGLSPDGAYINSQLHEERGDQEFTDILLSYSGGSIVIESKTLALFARIKVPTREKLARNLLPDLRKGARQLKGVCKNIHSGKKIFDKVSRNEIFIERNPPVHAICLVPDLSLLANCKDYGPSFLKDFMKANGDIFHVMDTTQLFRTVQAAHMLSRNSSQSAMAAFDAYLIMRFKFAAKNDILDFDMRLDLSSNPPRVSFTG